MRAMILAAVVGLGSTVALAGPSDHAARRFGDYSHTERPEMRKDRHSRNAPYALSGERTQRRVLKFRDVPKGRGQTELATFWYWVNE